VDQCVNAANAALINASDDPEMQCLDVARLHRLESSGSQSADTQIANSSGLYLTTSVTNLSLQKSQGFGE
jgi:hypothetical protein